MDELLKALPSLGVGGAIAGLMFWFYRTDSQRNIEQWKGQAEILVKVVSENTASNTLIAVLVKNLHEHLIMAKQINDRREVDK